MNLRPFPYEGSISKFLDQINVSPKFLDSRFRQKVDYKLRFKVLLARPLGFPCQQEGISKFLKNEIEVSPHPQDSLNRWEYLTPSLCFHPSHRCNCHCHTMSSSSTTSSASSDDSDNEPSDDDNEEEEQEAEPTTKMSPYHAKKYFNSTMGGKDLCGCHTRNLPDHKDPPFSKSKAYHSEVKPDSATLKLEVVR